MGAGSILVRSAEGALSGIGAVASRFKHPIVNSFIAGSGLLRRVSVGGSGVGSEGLSSLLERIAAYSRLGVRRATGVVRRFVMDSGGMQGAAARPARVLSVPIGYDVIGSGKRPIRDYLPTVARAGSSAGPGRYLDSTYLSYSIGYGATDLGTISRLSALPSAIENGGIGLYNVGSGTDLGGVIRVGVDIAGQLPRCRLMPTTGLVQQLHSDSIGHCMYGAGRVRSVFRRLYNFSAPGLIG